MNDLSRFSYDAALHDGSLTHLRAIRPDDKQQLVDVFHRLSGKSIYFRFFSAKRDLTENDLRHFTEIDFDNHVAIAATIVSEGKERIIGIGRYIQLEDRFPERVAEVAFAVDDEHHHLGVGTTLFDQIVTIAKNSGISRLVANVMLDNFDMLNIFYNSGFKLKRNKSYGIEHIEFNI